MELPITPKFFKKIELYQELSRLDKRNGSHVEWSMEKDLLRWAHTNHFHLGSYLSTEAVMQKLKDMNKYDPSALNEHVFKVMQNLEEHGWANWWPQRGERNEIKINKEGLLFGEVITDIHNRKKRVYDFFIFMSWLVIASSVALLLIGAAKEVISIFT